MEEKYGVSGRGVLATAITLLCSPLIPTRAHGRHHRRRLRGLLPTHPTPPPRDIRDELGEAAPGFHEGQRSGAREGIRLGHLEAIAVQMEALKGPQMQTIHELIVQETSKPVQVKE